MINLALNFDMRAEKEKRLRGMMTRVDESSDAIMDSMRSVSMSGAPSESGNKKKV